ncbi:ABATE domain-containing protein [Amycolatopsis sp. NPDC051061]|uniref:CGNR zinc finger domain-containing protein n=1 Tax=Amycolatopsis sp. NPDC051061 TaxID=3155042 RepID=UPI00342420EC
MPDAASPPLCFAFTATVRERGARPVDRIATDNDLLRWLEVTGLLTGAPPAVESEIAARARELREAIHRAGLAVAAGTVPDGRDEATLNRWAARSSATRVLDRGRTTWAFPADRPVHAALALIAVDAVETLGGDDPIRTCAAPGCGALFVDTSRPRNRRWCSMATCGNRAKKANRRGSKDGIS